MSLLEDLEREWNLDAKARKKRKLEYKRQWMAKHRGKARSKALKALNRCEVCEMKLSSKLHTNCINTTKNKEKQAKQ